MGDETNDYAWDDADRLRSLQSHADDEATRNEGVSSGRATSLVGMTTSQGSYPGSPQRFYAITPVDILGTEVEGSMGNTTSSTATIFAFNLGTQAPPAGSSVLCTYVSYRFVFRWDG